MKVYIIQNFGYPESRTIHACLTSSVESEIDMPTLWSEFKSKYQVPSSQCRDEEPKAHNRFKGLCKADGIYPDRTPWEKDLIVLAFINWLLKFHKLEVIDFEIPRLRYEKRHEEDF